MNVSEIWPKTSREVWMREDYIPGLATVIITTYQRADYIVKTVNSVFNQDYRPIELIVINDGSKDNTKECLDIWVNSLPTDKLFKFIYHYQDNTGAPAARNFALSISSGEFIQEIGSDDLIHPNKLSIHIKALKNHEYCDSAWSPLKRFKDDEEEDLYKRIDGTENSINNIEVREKNSNIFEPQFLPSAGLHRRSVFYKTGPWMESLKRWQDLEYQSRMALCVSYYLAIDEPMYFFRQHNGVRINSMYKSVNGIEPGFLVLKTIEKNLNYFNHKNIAANIEISNFYVTLATLSAENNYFKGIQHAIAGAIRNRRDISFLFKMKVFLIISFLFGGVTAYRIGRLYQKTRKQ